MYVRHTCVHSCMYVCLHVCKVYTIFISIYVHMYIYIYINMYVDICIHVYTQIHGSMHLWTCMYSMCFLSINVNVFKYLFLWKTKIIYKYGYMDMWIYIYLNIYIYIYLFIYMGLPGGGGVSRMYLHPHSSYEYTICKMMSIAIICSQKTQYCKTGIRLSICRTSTKKMNTLCRNSDVHHQNTLGTCIFLGQNKILHKTFITPAKAHNSQESWWPKCRIHAQALIVPKNRGILGNLGPLHESCTLSIRILANLGPVQVLFPFVILKIKICTSKSLRT